MASKRYQPSLIVIPEEQAISLNENGLKTLPEDQEVENIIAKDEEAHKNGCAGCPGCSADKTPHAHGAGCKNCGEKRNSIRKWLEGVSKHEGDHVLSDHETDPSAANQSKPVAPADGAPSESDVDSMRKDTKNGRETTKTSESSSSSDTDTVKANSKGSKSTTSSSDRKKIPPPLPSTAPKIISHYLKREMPGKVTEKSMQNRTNANGSEGNGSRAAATTSSNHNSSNINTNIPSIHQNGNARVNSSANAATAIFEKPEIYNNNSMSIPGSDIYNNPSFMLNSPPQSLRSRNSKQSRSSRSSRKRIEVLDQYSNPMLLQQNGGAVPDMVYEAIQTNDYTQRNGGNLYSGIPPPPPPLAGQYGHLNRLVPTPDYDDPNSTLSSIKQRYANVYDERFQVPTPDYSTTPMRNKNGKLYQPDSPIYHRKSPHYLIVDYETDSLERSSGSKANRNHSLTPQSNHSSDVGSQPSPSLSAALPLEEEVVVRNTVYDRVEGFRKDGDPMRMAHRLPMSNKSIYEEVRTMSSMQREREPRIRYNTPFHGSMTIEVEHSPTDTEMSTDSDQFEPDTLDRKPKKMFNNNNLMNGLSKKSNGMLNGGGGGGSAGGKCTSIPNNQRTINAWNNHLQKSADFLNHIDSKVNYSSLENMTSLPDMKQLNNTNTSNAKNNKTMHDQQNATSTNHNNNHNSSNDHPNNKHIHNNSNSNGTVSTGNDSEQQVVLRSSGSFKSNSLGTYFSEIGAIMNNTNLDKSFCSLREIYEAKNQKNLQQRPTSTDVDAEEQETCGRLLTLEARHSKRQRQITLEKEKKKKIPPPDVIPLEGSKQSKPLRKDLMPAPPPPPLKPKNMTVWKAEMALDKLCNGSNHDKLNYEQFLPSDSTSNSSNSESTDITGLSENHNSHHANGENDSLHRPYSQVNKKQNLSKLMSDPLDSSDNNFTNSSDVQSSQPEHSDCNSESSTIKSSSTKFYYKTNLYQHAKANTLKPVEDTDKIEILSSKSLRRNDDRPVLMGETATDLMKELASDTTSFSPNLALASAKVFRVDVNTASNGMQIALGLKDRVKKSKDLKNAWKKFVNMATSKFQKTDSKLDADIVSSLSDGMDRDDGIASMNASDENVGSSSSSSSNLAQILSRTPSSSSSDTPPNRHGNRSEQDYGYISGDSNESRANNKKLYERFNFKANKANSSSNSSCSDSNDQTADSSLKNMMRMQDIKEISESDRSSLPSVKEDAKPATTAKNARDAPKLVDFIPKKIMMHTENAVDVKVYSSDDDERYSSGMSSDEDGHMDLDEMCESGAESVETNSVFFKKIRKNTNEH